jgi:hypothetical protein
VGEGCLPIPQEVGGLPEKVVYSKNKERGMREAYRDLAHIIHQCFCYNRPNRHERCGLMFSGRIHC